MNIILLGAQGSGKGTQAQLLKDKYNLVHVSTGDLLRETKDEKIKQQMKEGKLVSDEQMIALIKEKLASETKGAILDGFPRTLAQAEALDEITQIDAVIELKLTDEEALKRLAGRKTCRNCKAIYGAENPPKQNKCDKCNGEIYQREDDKPEAIKKRLERYHEETEPLVEYYKPRKITHSVDASKSIKEIFANVCRIIEELA